MPIDGLLFTALAHELRARLVNARIQGVYQPREDRLILQLRQPGENLRLLISTDPAHARVHLTDGTWENPLAPPPFCLFLRKHLIPGRVLDVIQPPYERLLELRIEGFADTGERAERGLIVEVMGRYSNVILVDRGSGLIMDAVKRIPAEINRHREILPNRKYLPPPPQEKLNPSQVDFDDFDRSIRHIPANQRIDKALQQSFMGFSPFAAREVTAAAGLSPAAVRGDCGPDDFLRVWETFRQTIARLEAGKAKPTAVSTGEGDLFWCFPIVTVTGEVRSFDTVQELLDWTFGRMEDRVAFDRLRQRLESLVRQHLGRLEKKASLQQAAVESAARAEGFKRCGDLLTANLYRLADLPPGTDRIAVHDYYSGQESVTIEIDPNLSPAQNAQKYYRRYQKAKKTNEKASRQLQATRSEQRYLESVQTALALSERLTDLQEIQTELEQQGYIEKRRDSRRDRERREEKKAEPLEWISSDGFRVLVGRNNRQNDRVTMEIARPDDLWFHVKEIPGAHVVVRSEGKEIPETTMEEAAHLAAAHSKAKESSNVPVDFTKRRYVRKPRGAKPGMVIYDHQQTVFVTPDERVLARLRPLEKVKSRT